MNLGLLEGRHYVSVSRRRRLRRHLVVRSTAVATRRNGGQVALRYVPISAHWTNAGASRVARRLNSEAGHAQ